MSQGFNLADYVTVDERITSFWQRYPAPEGSIQTELIWVREDGLSVAIRASLYAGHRLLATGIAQEERGTAGANRNNWWENCETSAIGRACANLDMALSRQRASREEMEKATRPPDPPPSLEEIVGDPFAATDERKAALHKLYQTAETIAELNQLVTLVNRSGLDPEILRAGYRYHHTRIGDLFAPSPHADRDPTPAQEEVPA